MVRMRSHYRRTAGFTLTELLVVIAIGLIVTTIAIPNMMAAIGNIRLRSAATGLLGLVQETRISAVRDNKQYGMLSVVGTSATGAKYTLAWIDINPDGAQGTYTNPNTNQSAPEPAVLAPTNIILVDGAAAPNPIDTSGWGYTPQSSLPMSIGFNSRGLPCVYDTTTTQCKTGTAGAKGFLYYLSSTPPFASTLWAAVSITPAGRAKVWLWDGKHWF